MRICGILWGSKEANGIGLKINIGKTKSMRINVRTNTPLHRNKLHIEEVEEYFGIIKRGKTE